MLKIKLELWPLQCTCTIYIEKLNTFYTIQWQTKEEVGKSHAQRTVATEQKMYFPLKYIIINESSGRPILHKDIYLRQ